MSEITDQLHLVIQEELQLLISKLRARKLKLRVTKPSNYTPKMSLRDADIECEAKDAKGDMIFEFNFSSRLKKALRDLLSHSPGVKGLDFALNGQNQHTVGGITSGKLNKEKQQLKSQVDKTKAAAQKRAKEQLATKPYGNEIAKRVYLQLIKGPLCYSHRDYCGTGFQRIQNRVDYGEFLDGSLATVLLSFGSEEKFVTWLGQQSDRTMARLGDAHFLQGNQTITLQRLIEFTT